MQKKVVSNVVTSISNGTQLREITYTLPTY